MRIRISMAAFAITLLAGTASVAYAQGSMTQDPGKMSPGNLTTNGLGPSAGTPATGGNGTLGAGDTNGNWSGAGYGSGTTLLHGTPGSSTGTGPDIAPGHGRSAGVSGGGSPGTASGGSRNGPSSAGGTPAIGSGR